MTSPGTPIVLACAADDNYAMPLAVTVCSLLSNLQSDNTVSLFILDGGIKQRQKRRIIQSIQSDRLNITWIKPSDVLLQMLSDRVTFSEKWPIANYYRLLLPYIIPQHVEKVLYIDTDLVIQGDISQLWSLDLGEHYALAAQDVCQPYIALTKHLDYQKLGVSKDCKYMNAGVLMMNLKRWREDHITEKTLAFINQHRETLLIPDQDALNVILAQQWGELQPQWNQMHGIYDFASWKESPYEQDAYEQAMQTPKIVHFTTQPKPWMKGCLHPKRSLFYQYLDRTAWSGWRNTVWRRAWRRLIKEFNQLRFSASMS